MSKKKFVVVFAIILLLSLFSIESFTKFFGTKTVTLHVTKKSYFVFDLVIALDNVALGPGETTLVEPKVVNDSTENMYVFVKVSNPKYDGERLYLYDVNDSWILVDDTSDEAEVYAYASSDSEMTTIGNYYQILYVCIQKEKFFCHIPYFSRFYRHVIYTKGKYLK